MCSQQGKQYLKYSTFNLFAPQKVLNPHNSKLELKPQFENNFHNWQKFPSQILLCEVDIFPNSKLENKKIPVISIFESILIK